MSGRIRFLYSDADLYITTQLFYGKRMNRAGRTGRMAKTQKHVWAIWPEGNVKHAEKTPQNGQAEKSKRITFVSRYKQGILWRVVTTCNLLDNNAIASRGDYFKDNF